MLPLLNTPSASKDDVAGVLGHGTGYGIKRVMSGQPAQCVGFT